MSPDEPVTLWLNQLQAGDSAAAQKIWECYYRRLVRLARKNFRGVVPRLADEEDVASSALESFYRGAQNGRFPQLSDRDNLWRILVVLTARKAAHLLRHEQRQKRGGRVKIQAVDDGDDALLQQLAAQDPTPQFAAQVADECRRLLERLVDPHLKKGAVWKMEGYAHAQISAMLGCAPRSLERKLQLIRTIWQDPESSVP